MGRTHFGSQQTIAEVVANAHARGMTVSGDFLINLPGQGVDAMMRDMETAVGIGFDQICVYNLVLFPGIGSKWSQDPEMLARMHPVETAYQNWLAVRRMLCEQGYQQTTLTNFERGAVRFDYEVQSYTLQKYNGLGFGPNAITLLSRGQSGIKTIMEEDYPFVEGRDDGRFKEYVYDARSLMVMYLARNLSRGYVHFADFAEDPRNHFQDEFALLEERGLAYVNETSLTLTERGMFFADAIIALIAKQEINYLKSLERRVIHLKKDDYEYSGGGM
jgi:oxygen-independent coproporphyrinogen-3 oxidase